MHNGLNLIKILKIFDQKIKSKESKTRKLRLLIGVSRMFGAENTMNIINVILKCRSPYIIGIDLGGKEKGYPASNFSQVFKRARENNLHVVAHAGEEVGPESIWSAIRDLRVERIGHATSAYLDKNLIEYLHKTQIPLEICLTSSTITRAYVDSIESHPIEEYITKGLMVTINSDDPLIFNTDITKEYILLYKKLNFSTDMIVKLIHNGINATFLPEAEKNKWQRKITLLLKTNH